MLHLFREHLTAQHVRTIIKFSTHKIEDLLTAAFMLHVYDVCLLDYGSKQINMVASAFWEIVYLTTTCIKSRLSFILRTNTMSVPNDPTTPLPIEKKILEMIIITSQITHT